MIEWLNQNAARAYPLAETCTRLSVSGQSLADDLLVDMRVTVGPEYESVYLAGLSVTDAYVALSVCGLSADQPVPLFNFVRAISDVRPLAAMALARAPGLLNVGGWVTLGPGITSRRVRMAFYPEAARLDSGAVRRISPAPVLSFRKVGGSSDVVLRGNVRFIGEGYMRLAADPEDPGIVNVSLDRQAAYETLPGPCNKFTDTAGACASPVVRSINGVCGDENGIITLRFE